MEATSSERQPLFSNDALKRLIVPLIIEQVLAVMVGMVDTVMVSHVGEAATSGVSLVDLFNQILIYVFSAVATGGAVVVSQYLGQNNREKAHTAADQLMLITCLVAGVIMVAVILLRHGLLQLLYGAIAPDVRNNALIYLVISALSYPFLAAYNSCAALFRSMGNSKISMEASVIMNIINLVGNAWLILGLGMGVAGAALTSLVSRMVACMILLVRLRNPALEISIGKSKLHFNGKIIHQILHIGIPGGVENSVFQLGRVLVVGIIALFGTSQIAANAVANSLDALGTLPGQAMSLAVITVIGRCVGANDFEQADYYARKMMKITYAITVAACMIVLITLPLTLPLYGLTEETRRLAWLLIVTHNICAMFLWPAAFTLTNIMRAANDVRFPMILVVMTMCCCRIVLGYVLAVWCHMESMGVWIAMFADWIIRACFLVPRFFSGKWKTFYHGLD